MMSHAKSKNSGCFIKRMNFSRHSGRSTWYSASKARWALRSWRMQIVLRPCTSACWPPNAESPRLLGRGEHGFVSWRYHVIEQLEIFVYDHAFLNAWFSMSYLKRWSSIWFSSDTRATVRKSPASFFWQTIYLLHHTPSFLQRQVGNQTAAGFRFGLQPDVVHNAFSKGACDKQLIHCALVRKSRATKFQPSYSLKCFLATQPIDWISRKHPGFSLMLGSRL